MNSILQYNPYDLRNYRATNSRLPFAMPGELFELSKQDIEHGEGAEEK